MTVIFYLIVICWRVTRYSVRKMSMSISHFMEQYHQTSPKYSKYYFNKLCIVSVSGLCVSVVRYIPQLQKCNEKKLLEEMFYDARQPAGDTILNDSRWSTNGTMVCVSGLLLHNWPCNYFERERRLVAKPNLSDLQKLSPCAVCWRKQLRSSQKSICLIGSLCWRHQSG